MEKLMSEDMKMVFDGLFFSTFSMCSHSACSSIKWTRTKRTKKKVIKTFHLTKASRVVIKEK